MSNINNLNQFILNFNQIHDYLRWEDLIELSSVNSVLRNKLKWKLFEIINIKEFLMYNVFEESDKADDYELEAEDGGFNKDVYADNATEGDEDISDNYTIENENSESELQRKKSINHSALYSKQNFLKFKPKIENYPYKLNTVKAFDIIDNGFILNLSQSFNNLKHLQISLASISFEDLAQSLSNLNLLESFYLQECAIYKSEDTNANDLKLPNSLKSLFVHNCEEVSKDLRLDPIKISQEYFDLETDAFDLNVQYLPQLEEFTYNQEHFESTIISQFLSLNPQIKSLELISESLTEECLQLLSRANQIKHLEVEFHDIGQNEYNSFTFPQLSSLQSFSVRIAELPSLPIIQNIAKCSPNIVEFSIDYDSSFELVLNDTLLNLTKLQTLILLGGDYKEDFTYSLPLELVNLECLQLPKLNLNTLDLTVFTKYKNMKLIKIPLNEDDELTVEELDFVGWRVINYKNYIHIYEEQ